MVKKLSLSLVLLFGLAISGGRGLLGEGTQGGALIPNGITYEDGYILVKVREMELEKLFEEIAKQSGIELYIHGERMTEKVTADIERMPLRQVLEDLIRLRGIVNSGFICEGDKIKAVSIFADGRTGPGTAIVRLRRNAAEGDIPEGAVLLPFPGKGGKPNYVLPDKDSKSRVLLPFPGHEGKQNWVQKGHGQEEEARTNVAEIDTSEEAVLLPFPGLNGKPNWGRKATSLQEEAKSVLPGL